jgi:phage/plasmid-like protein (TIGR03299 family)
MMYYGAKPWHKMGNEVMAAQTSAEAIIAAGLNWEVKKEQLYLKDGREADGAMATMRTDTNKQLGIVGNVYRPLQNKEAFSFFDAVVGEKLAIYHTAGALGAGEVVWMLAKLPGYIRTIGDDVSEKFLLLTNSHDGTSVVKVMFTPIRVVCQNTLNIALSGSEKIARLKHCSTMGMRLDYVRETIGLVSSQFTMFEDITRRMAAHQVTSDALKKFVVSSGVVPITADGDKPSSRAYNIMEDVSKMFEYGKGADMPGAKGTLWGAFNAVVEYVDYARSSKGDNRAKSLLMGSGANVKQKAWDSAVSLIK